MNSKIITVTIQKGGVAKTTTAAVLAQAAIFRGFRVLAIDLDPQGNFSQALNVRGNVGQNASVFLRRTRPAEQIPMKSPQGMDVIPAAWDLSTLKQSSGSARRLSAALEPIRGNYDLIIIDTPSSGELQYNALQASTGLLIPLQADAFNLQSFYQITDIAKQFKRTNPDLTISGAIMTRFDGRTKHSRQVRDIIRKQVQAEGIPYLGEIRQCIAVQEATTLQKSLYAYASRSTAAGDYLRVLDNIMKGS